MDKRKNENMDLRDRENGETLLPAAQENTYPGDRAGAAKTGTDAFRREVAELLKLRPELREKLIHGEGIPQEVLTACAKDGISLRTAYAEYEAEQAKEENKRLRREISILKQNASAAAKAPVKGTAAGGSTETKGKDPFLEGLLSDDE